MRAPVISLLIDLPPEHRYHEATVAAIDHASQMLNLRVELRIVPTDAIDARLITDPGSAVVVGPGSPYRNPEAVLEIVRGARERGIPLLGTWGGFQHVLVEHARSLAGIRDAVHAEYGAGGTAVISLLACSLQDQTITVKLTPGSRLAALYGTPLAVESTTCSYGLAPEMQHIASEHGMRVAAIDDTAEVRAIERTDHPFFVGTL